MFQQFKSSVWILFLLTIITGVIYPLVITGVAQLAFPSLANGSLIKQGDRIIGSTLIGQPMSQAKYFWGRLSATSGNPYNAAASGGSNLGPMHADLKLLAESRLKQLGVTVNSTANVPVDLVTASASGLDPHISWAAAEFQIPRIAKARNVSEKKILELYEQHREKRQFGIFGEPVVNVLKLNLALDALEAK